MTDTPPKGRSFPELAAAYIDLANTQGQETDQEFVSIAFLHAAARYAAFIAAINSSGADQMKTDRTENLNTITAKFREFLELHYTEYSDNFDTYLVRSK